MFVNTYARYLENGVEVHNTPDSSNVLQEALQEFSVKPDETEESRYLHNKPSTSVPHRSGRIPRSPNDSIEMPFMHTLNYQV